MEWFFGDIVNYFKFIDFKKNLKIGLSSIGKLYIVCAVLQNALSCLYGNLTSEFFLSTTTYITGVFRVMNSVIMAMFITVVVL